MRELARQSEDSASAGKKGTNGKNGLAAKLRLLLIGRPKDFRDPRIFQHVSLIAFLAWVGLGADGLSSSCYGPEEAFLRTSASTPTRALPGRDG